VTRARRLGLAVGLALTITLLVLLQNDPLVAGHPNWSRPWDHQKYLFMAEHPFELRLAPFSWRILGPFVAGLLPFGLAASFRLVAVASVAGTAVVLFVLLRRRGHAPHLALAGMLAFLSIGWVTGYPLYNSWLPDALAFLFVALAVLAAHERRPVAFAAVLVAGVLTRETVLFVAPLWYGLHAARLIDRKLLAQAVGLALPALAAVVAVRLALPADNTDPSYLAELDLSLNEWDTRSTDPLSLFELFGEPVRLRWWPVLVSAWVGGAFDTLPLLALFAWRRNLVTALRWSPFLVLVAAQPLFAANTFRLIALAFPLVVIVAVDGLAALQRRLGLDDAWVVAVPGALVVADLLVPGNAIWLVPELFLVAGVLAVGWWTGTSRSAPQQAKIPG